MIVVADTSPLIVLINIGQVRNAGLTISDRTAQCGSLKRRRKRKAMSAEARAKISAAEKKHWAKRKKKASAKSIKPTQPS